MKVCVFIACSLDGFIADENGKIDWLTTIPVDGDAGYSNFMKDINAILMGRKTFEFVQTLDSWPYKVPVFVYSKTQKIMSNKFLDKIMFTDDSPVLIIKTFKDKGIENIYIDGGQVIKAFLEQNLIDEMIITRTSTLLGKGIPLFQNIKPQGNFVIAKCEPINQYMVQIKYIRKR